MGVGRGGEGDGSDDGSTLFLDLGSNYYPDVCLIII